MRAQSPLKALKHSKMRLSQRKSKRSKTSHTLLRDFSDFSHSKQPKNPKTGSDNEKQAHRNILAARAKQLDTL
jgi:hypothetical protein